MADIVTGTVTGQVDESNVLRDIGTIRREQAVENADLRREVAIGVGDVNSHVKDSGWQNLDKTANVGDRVTDQGTAYFIAAQAINFQNATALAALTASNNANFNQTLAAIQLAATQTSAAATLAGSQSAAASALAAAQTQQIVMQDGNATRALINSQTVDELRFRNLEEKYRGDHGHGRGCKEGVFSFGPPTGATYPT